VQKRHLLWAHNNFKGIVHQQHARHPQRGTPSSAVKRSVAFRAGRLVLLVDLGGGGLQRWLSAIRLTERKDGFLDEPRARDLLMQWIGRCMSDAWVDRQSQTHAESQRVSPLKKRCLRHSSVLADSNSI
jgi:hypothetical protein